jgi:ProP effector
MPQNSRLRAKPPTVVVVRKRSAKPSIISEQLKSTSTPPSSSSPLIERRRVLKTPVPPPPKAENKKVEQTPQGLSRQETLALLEILLERWPEIFPSLPAAMRPLAVGIDQEIASLLTDYSPDQIRRAIAFWRRLHPVAYQKTLAAGGPRYDLSGSPQGEVTPQEQERAMQQLAAWSANRQAKLAARKQAKQEHETKRAAEEKP